MPYRYGFLTPKLREYLEHERMSMDAQGRALWDLRVRRMLKQSLEDVIFVVEKLDKKQFNKISEDLYGSMIRFLLAFAERYFVDVPIGRIRRYRKLVYAKHILDASSFFLEIGNLLLESVVEERKKEVSSL